MTQQELGGRCGYSHSVISRIENGHTVPDWPTVARLAAILGIRPEDLGLARSSGQPPTGAAPGPQATKVPSRPDIEDWEDAVRRRQMLALTGTTAAAALGALPGTASAAPPHGADPDLSGLEDALLYGPPPARAEATASTVARAVAEAREQLAQGRYRELAAGFPHQLALAEEWKEQDGGAALAALFATGARAAIKAGDDRLVTLSADRAVLAARDSGDALALAEAYRMVSSGYRRTGRHDRAVQIAVRAADQLAADRTAPRAAGASVRGNLLATAAYTAAKAGDGAGARELIGAARAAAEPLGAERVAGGGWFGPRQVALHEVSVFQVLGEPATAVAKARSIDSRGLPRERAARLCVDVARSYADWGRPEGCYRALIAAERAVPQEVRRDSVRRLTRGLLRHDRVVPGARDLAHRSGAVGV